METYNGLPLLKISLEDNEQGVNKISLVDEPAIEENWLAFSKVNDEDLEMMFAEIQAEQKLAGPLLIPDKPILRRHPKTKEKFYVKFPKEVIAEIASRFNKNLFGGNWNVDHNKDVNDVYVAENWIIEDPKFDKSRKFGHSLPAGTWYGIVKVDNNKVWKNDIETGKLRGFSVELLSGLKLEAVEKAVEDFHFENHVAEVLGSGKVGEQVSDKWQEIGSYELDEHEEDLTEENLIELAIQANPNADSNLDVETKKGKYMVRYRYVGPFDDKNRSFCASILTFQSANVVFRREDINQMSFTTSNPQFGTYSIFRYKGSFGCRHKWQRIIFFEDFEDEETRRVGNVPSVTGNINDKDARTINANLKTDNMAEKNKFAMLEELPMDERIVGASVDNEDGEYTIEGVKYMVADNVITEVIPEVTDGDEPPAEGDVAPEDLKKFMGEVLGWMAETQAQIEALNSKVNGSDESSNEQFAKITEGVDKLTSLLSLLPAEGEGKNEPEVVAGTIATALNRIKEESAKRKELKS